MIPLRSIQHLWDNFYRTIEIRDIILSYLEKHKTYYEELSISASHHASCLRCGLQVWTPPDTEDKEDFWLGDNWLRKSEPPIEPMKEEFTFLLEQLKCNTK